MDDRIISIGKAAKILGVSSETLREWERKGELSPIYTKGNHRRYNKADIETLYIDKKKKNFKEKFSIKELEDLKTSVDSILESYKKI